MSMYFHEYDYSALITIISAIITAMDRIIIIVIYILLLRFYLAIDFDSVCNTTTNLFR